ncbi:hypothetical protein MMPV_004202 [Pyropia vietnamensis]
MAAVGVGGGAPLLVDYAEVKDRCKEFLRDFRVVTPPAAAATPAAGVDEIEEPPPDGVAVFKYREMLRDIVHGTRRLFAVEVDDVIAWGGAAAEAGAAAAATEGADGVVGGGDTVAAAAAGTAAAGISIAEAMVANARRYKEVFSLAADDLLAALEEEEAVANPAALEQDAVRKLAATRRALEVANRRRQAAEAGVAGGAVEDVAEPGGAGSDPFQIIPRALTRRYETVLLPPTTQDAKTRPLRAIRAADVGRLVTVKGVVTRVTEVKPRVEIAGYVCLVCGHEVYQTVPERSYLPLSDCPVRGAHETGPPGRLVATPRSCKYVKYQELKLQEPADQVPVGHIPRTLTVQLSGELTRSATAGDVVAVSGIFLPLPYSGLRALKAGMLADTYLEATAVAQLKKDYADMDGGAASNPETAAALAALAADANVYSRLARSIAPEIWGHEDVKKALLLLLVGAPARRLGDGMRLRGDVHVCLMGDPGVAKSQLLKHMSVVAPRAVYTTGKGSSGVGLTAAVLRDAVTGELMLEGGALVLADGGVAAIDEFDKMGEADRTAIHEVMEQQTVSIAKAGITTTLNARAAVLAAANPAYGRFNRARTPAENINLPAALLSRFDLLFLLLDVPDAAADLALARHVTTVHRTGAVPVVGVDADELDDRVPPSILRAHIAAARSAPPPLVPPGGALAEYIVSSYVALRGEEAAAGRDARGYTTPRTLLSVLRLSQALARLRRAPEVAREDVDEALRLMAASKNSLDVADAADARRRRRRERGGDAPDTDTDGEGGGVGAGGGAGGGGGAAEDAENLRQTVTWRVLDLLTDVRAAKGGPPALAYADFEGPVLAAGYTREQLADCLDHCDDLHILANDVAAGEIRWV